MKVIALLTDFGYIDAYVGQMKAVVLRLCPEAKVIDITHGVPKYDVLWGSHLLRVSRKYFPKGTVFVGVIDPGVGSERRGIIIEGAEGNTYVGPDNGLLYPSAAEEGIKAVHELTPKKWGLREIGKTFHGREVFAPAAALVACGVSPASLGSEVSSEDLVKQPSLPQPPEIIGDSLRTEVVHIDSFGNVITALSSLHLRELLNIELGDCVEVSGDGGRSWILARYGGTFSDVPEGEYVLYEGSHELIELGMNKGNAATELKVSRETKLLLRKALNLTRKGT